MAIPPMAIPPRATSSKSPPRATGSQAVSAKAKPARAKTKPVIVPGSNEDLLVKAMAELRKPRKDKV